MHKDTFKNKIINKTSDKIERANELIKRGSDLIKYSAQLSEVSPGYVYTEYFIGWKSSAEAYLLSLDNVSFYNNFKEHCTNDTEQSVNVGISILNNSRDYLRSSYTNGNYWNYSNPFWLIWQFLKILWCHKIISSIIITLFTAYLIYLFGWN